MNDTLLSSETPERSPIDFSAVQRAAASARRTPEASPHRPPVWLRVLVGSDLARHAMVDAVTGADAFRLVWWSVGLTPTARLRNRRFREALADGRSTLASVGRARQVS
jgi:hypothetical protein